MKPIGLSTPPPTPTPCADAAARRARQPSAQPASGSGSAAASGSAVRRLGRAVGVRLGSRRRPVAPSASGRPRSPSAAPSDAGGIGLSCSPPHRPSPSPSASPSPPARRRSPSGPGIPTTGKLGEVAAALQAQFGPIDGQRSLTTVGPVVSADLINQAFALILVGALGILLWITFRFHDVKFGVTALVALLHDVIVVVGTFAILGTVFGVEIDALFVTAMLTVIGFSVHDTIVVFDRIRENKARHAGEPFEAIVNHSILQTFGRSINTSLTVVFTLLALLLFGGAAIQVFVLALLIGIISGTYSSIFNASPLLVVWQEWEDRRQARLQAQTRATRRATRLDVAWAVAPGTRHTAWEAVTVHRRSSRE